MIQWSNDGVGPESGNSEIQKCHSGNAEMSQRKCGNVTVEMWKLHHENVHAPGEVGDPG